MSLLVASDWHLGTRTPAREAALARAFLARALRAGDEVILNGDVFEGLFERAARAEAAHAEVARLLRELERAGRLARTEGNHDPGAGAERVVRELPRAGRVLFTHGHAIDPMHGSPLGRLGDGISRRFGTLALVRGAASFAERAAMAIAGERILRDFAARGREAAAEAGCALAVFGHVHRQHLAPGDAYANAGWLTPEALEYLSFDGYGPRACRLTAAEATP